MTALLSGAKLISGASNSYITLATAQPQLPATPSTTTGFTLITEVVYPTQLVTRYASSLGNIEFTTGTMQANLPNLNINIVGTGTGTIIVAGYVANTNSDTGVLVVKGGIGISEGIHTGKDIVVNSLTIGQGYSNLIGGVNNIVITGTASPQLNAFPVGQESIVIGYDALKGIDTAYKVIAIGRYAASTGTQLENIIAIGDSALQKIGTTQTEFAGFISGVISANTLTLTVLNHTLTTGTGVLIKNVVGMTELNEQTYFVNVKSTSSIALYTDINLQTGVDASTYNGYVSGGNIYKTLLWNGNFAIGNNAGKNLINGEQNFFLGYNPAPNFTTGSYNFFMGHDIAQNMIRGNANISIGGDNMVDGQDDQVNIGSVFYYNGAGYLELNADTGLGLGTDSTSTVSGAFNVDGGAGITGKLYVGGELHVVNTTPATTTTDGALVVAGGVGIGGDLWVGGTLYATALSSLVSSSSQYTEQILVNPTSTTNYYLALTSITSGVTSIYSPGDIEYDGLNDVLIVGSRIDVTNTTPSANTYSGALTVYGGVGIGGRAYIGGGITAGDQSFIDVNSVLTYPSFTPSLVLKNNGSNTAAFSLQNNASQSVSFVNFAGLLNIESTGVKIAATATSTSTSTGALQVAGGVGVKGSVYSQDGNPLQNYLLYTPKVTITDTGLPPPNPKPGDFWIDTQILAELQFIQDGTSTFWIQITSL